MKNIQNIRKVGVDLAKNVIQIYAVYEGGQATMNRRFSRAKALEFFDQLKPCVIGMEACGGAHHWGRILEQLGHQVRMIPAQYVKAYVKTNKNDAADAQAVYEAMCRPGMRYVKIKSEEQQAVLLAHRVREQLIKQRTQTVNAMRAHCAEFGVLCAKGGWNAKRLVALIEAGENRQIPQAAYEMLRVLSDHLQVLNKKIAQTEAQIKEYFKADEACQRLAEIPGIGVLTATCLVATVGDAGQFYNGRHLAAFLGLVPKQWSTGGKTTLRGISKRWDKYLRRLLIHGARSLCRPTLVQSKRCPHKLKRLLEDKQKKVNVAAVATANTNARIAWALLFVGERYDPDYVARRRWRCEAAA